MLHLAGGPLGPVCALTCLPHRCGRRQEQAHSIQPTGRRRGLTRESNPAYLRSVHSPLGRCVGWRGRCFDSLRQVSLTSPHGKMKSEPQLLRARFFCACWFPLSWAPPLGSSATSRTRAAELPGALAGHRCSIAAAQGGFKFVEVPCACFQGACNPLSGHWGRVVASYVARWLESTDALAHQRTGASVR